MGENSLQTENNRILELLRSTKDALSTLSKIEYSPIISSSGLSSLEFSLELLSFMTLENRSYVERLIEIIETKEEVRIRSVFDLLFYLYAYWRPKYFESQQNSDGEKTVLFQEAEQVLYERICMGNIVSSKVLEESRTQDDNTRNPFLVMYDHLKDVIQSIINDGAERKYTEQPKGEQMQEDKPQEKNQEKKTDAMDKIDQQKKTKEKPKQQKKGKPKKKKL